MTLSNPSFRSRAALVQPRHDSQPQGQVSCVQTGTPKLLKPRRLRCPVRSPANATFPSRCSSESSVWSTLCTATSTPVTSPPPADVRSQDRAGYPPQLKHSHQRESPLLELRLNSSPSKISQFFIFLF